LESDGSHIFDGAMGTMLYSKGIYINRSYDELNLVAADLVREVHDEYIRAGAEIIETNTFGANVNKLQPYGLEASMREINIKAARELCDLPIVAQITIQLDGNTLFGATVETFTKELHEWGVDVIGLNCGVGPAIVLNAIEKMHALTDRRLSAQPNAGLPRDVGGRQIYMCSPEYMAEYSRRIVQAGAKFVGGCCGTTPAHIKMI